MKLTNVLILSTALIGSSPSKASFDVSDASDAVELASNCISLAEQVRPYIRTIGHHIQSAAMRIKSKFHRQTHEEIYYVSPFHTATPHPSLESDEEEIDLRGR